MNMHELVEKWRREAAEYPAAIDERAHAAAVAVRLCADELSAALRAPAVTGEAGRGSWPSGYIGRAFVAGASWWQFFKHGSTPFPSERDEMEAEAVRRYGEPSAPPAAGAPEIACPDCHADVAFWTAQQEQGAMCTGCGREFFEPAPAAGAPPAVSRNDIIALLQRVRHETEDREVHALSCDGGPDGEYTNPCTCAPFNPALALDHVIDELRAAAGAPPALVALVQEWQEARRAWDETRSTEPPDVERRGKRLQASVAALLEWSPALASVIAALRAPAVTGESAQHAETLRVMADDHATPDTDVRRQRRAACLAGAEALAAPPAAGAPPAAAGRRQRHQAGDQCRVGESMADDYFQHAAECPECSAYEAARVDSIRRGAAGAPPALVALVQAGDGLCQSARNISERLRGIGERTQAALWASHADIWENAKRALGSPAPAPVAPPLPPDYVVQRRFFTGSLPETAESLRDAQPAPVAPPAGYESQKLRALVLGSPAPPAGDRDATCAWDCALPYPHNGPCSAAPPAVQVGGDAPEIQVGDWVLTRFFGNTLIRVSSARVLDALDRGALLEARGERDGRPFIWRRQEGQ